MLRSNGAPDRIFGVLAIIVAAILLALLSGGAVGVFLGFGPAGLAVYVLAALAPGLLLVRLLIRGIRTGNPPILDPVPGTLLVTGCGGDPTEAMYASCRLTGVLSAPGMTARAVTHKGYVRTSTWPTPGVNLPVVVDRQDPQRFRIEWTKVGTGQQLAMDQAGQIATQMRTGSEGPTLLDDGIPAGLPVLLLENANLDQLRAAVRQNGAPGRAILNQARPGAPLPDGQQFHLDGWLHLDDGQSLALRNVTVAVPADQITRVTPGRVVPTRTALVNGFLTTVHQWELR